MANGVFVIAPPCLSVFGQESAKLVAVSSSNGSKTKLMPATLRSETGGVMHTYIGGTVGSETGCASAH